MFSGGSTKSPAIFDDNFKAILYFKLHMYADLIRLANILEFDDLLADITGVVHHMTPLAIPYLIPRIDPVQNAEISSIARALASNDAASTSQP
jgi:hypothetical protein